MIKAVIDIGSNSIKMRIAKIFKSSKRVNVIRDETEVVRLGRGMTETGLLSYESMKNSCEAVAKMVNRARKLDAQIFIVGTMALRSALNSAAFLNMVQEKTGLRVHVFTGEDEAKYSWLGAVDGFNLSSDIIMFDSGGGSTEFVSGSNGNVNKIASVPIGAVNLSERYFYEHDKPIKKASCNKAIEHVKNVLLDNHIDKFNTNSATIIGVGGGVVTMASVKYACENFVPSKLHGSILTLKDVTRQINMYASLTLRERENVIGLPATRADIIMGSACIIYTVLNLLNAPSCIVSINGLRHGLLLSDNIL